MENKYKNWKSVYECPCGEKYTNSAGSFDRLFFLTDICSVCGREKKEFESLGIAYWEWKPSLLDWFNGEWIFKDEINHD